MRTSKFTVEQQKEYASKAQSSSCKSVAKELGISPQTVYNWTKKYSTSSEPVQEQTESSTPQG